DSGFAPAYLHPIRIVGELYGPAASRRYVAAYLALSPGDIDAEGIRLASRQMALTSTRLPALGSLLNSASSDVLMSALDALPEGADSTEPELEVVRLIVSDRLTTNTRTRDPTVLDPVFRRSLMSNAFFFSSRRRHTSLQGDWSSDVCSSDLASRRCSRRPMSCSWWTGTTLPTGRGPRRRQASSANVSPSRPRR